VVPAKLGWCDRGSVRQFSGFAKSENARLANGTSLRERARNRTLARRTTTGRKGDISRVEIPSPTRSRPDSDARFWRNGLDRFENRSRRNKTISGKHSSVRAGGKFGRRRK